MKVKSKKLKVESIVRHLFKGSVEYALAAGAQLVSRTKLAGTELVARAAASIGVTVAARASVAT